MVSGKEPQSSKNSFLVGSLNLTYCTLEFDLCSGFHVPAEKWDVNETAAFAYNIPLEMFKASLEWLREFQRFTCCKECVR